MTVAIVTGASGLVGGATARFLCDRGVEVAGIDNDLRAYFLGPEGSTRWNRRRIEVECRGYTHHEIDIRDERAVDEVFSRYGRSIALVVHCAGQPSHDWAAREPRTDFTVNALGTLCLLEATRRHCPGATFVFTSTNKVYGDQPNALPMRESATRFELSPDSRYAVHGFDESLSIDRSLHSIMGASKVAADLMVQEYGRYFGMKTVAFRAGCITGPAHSGAELHGFLAYLVKCQLTGREYRVFGYRGKQVRDNLHCDDLVEAFWRYHLDPRPGAVYNIGGSRASHCSILEAAAEIERLTGDPLRYELVDEPRRGDHVWWISDVRAFQRDYPGWRVTRDLEAILRELVEATAERVSRRS